MDTDHASFARVTAALEREMGPGQPSGQWTKYWCPVHEADGRHRNPSLAVKYLPGEHKTKVKCFTGCDDRDVLDKLGLKVRDLYDQPRTHRGRTAAPAPRVQPKPVSRATRAIDAAGLPLIPVKKDMGKQTSAWKQTDAYPYIRADGTVAGEVVREEAQFASGKDKRFHQHRWDTEKGDMVPGGFEALPFNLPQIQAAIADGEPIYIVEGEKDALTAMRAGLTATTNAGGASSWTPDHGRWLDGAGEVVIVVDHDAPGYRRAERVMDTLAGRVRSVRVVQAATGKDLTDHIDAGHHVDELVPVPYLDPLTTSTPAPAAAAVAPEPAPLENDGGTTAMGEISGLGMTEPQYHDDSIDHIASKFGQFVSMLLNQLIALATQNAERRKRALEEARARSEAAAREALERFNEERKATETRLAKMRKIGWDRFSRSDIAAAVRDAATWAQESEAAKATLQELAGHVNHRFGVHVDTETGHVTVDAPELARELAAVEQERAIYSRVHTAHDRMVSIIAAESGVEESAKAELYRDIDQWRRDPTGVALSGLTKKLEAAGVDNKTRRKVRFVAIYLGTGGEAAVSVEDLGGVQIATAASELRQMGEPLVDLGEEAKHGVDTMLLDYQTRLKNGLDTEGVQKRLSEAISVMTPEDQKIARKRGMAIRANPGEEFKPLWPNHIDRVQLEQTVRAWALLAPVVEARIVDQDGPEPQWAADQKARSEQLRREIEQALKQGEGLHDLERDQLQAIITDVEAGRTDLPELMWADDRSAAANDLTRSDEIARAVAADHRRQIEQILDTGAVPDAAVRHAGAEITGVHAAQTALAAGRTSLSDYEDTRVDETLLAKLRAEGTPEQVCNQLREYLDRSSSDSAATGKQSRRIQERWGQRRELVAAGRAPAPETAKPAPSAYDNDARRHELARRLRKVGLDEDVIADRIAADLGRATPPAAAATSTSKHSSGPRQTTPGAGVRRTHHRGQKG